jgi:hypothetical protein
MANTTQRTKAELEKENDTLKNSVTEMQEQMKQMMEQMKQMQNEPRYAAQGDITTRKIPVISLLHNPAILSTERFGAGVPYEFPEYGCERKIKYTDLERIVALCKTIAFETNVEYSFFERGCFYIDDKEAVEELGLGSFYEKMFTKKMVDDCINLKNETVINIFKTANDTVKESIVRAIIENINKGYNYDLNLLAIFSKVYGKDIQELAEKTKKVSPKTTE